MNNYFNNKTILLTGGTGSIGSVITKFLLKLKIKKLIIFSRDEFKQFEMNKSYQDSKLHFIIGDVRDYDSINSACAGVDIIIHTAAMKHVLISERNPWETVKTNIIGSQNVVEAAINQNVKNVVSLSTDKASMPINLYGATKLASDRLFIAANSSSKYTKFSVVRYGNVATSRGSVIPLYINLINEGFKFLPLTHKSMTRFWITPEEATNFIFFSLSVMKGGEIFIPKLRSFKVMDLITSFSRKYKITGITPGEKIHETMICNDEAAYTYEAKKYYVLKQPLDKKVPQSLIFNKNKLKLVGQNFFYSSNQKNNFIQIKDIRLFIRSIDENYQDYFQ